MNEPICGQQWLNQHRNDHTRAEIDSLAIELKANGKLLAWVKSGEKKGYGIVREIVNLNK